MLTDTEMLRTEMLVFHSGYYNVPTFLQNLRQEIFSIQRALPTMAYGQVFRIITRKLPRDPTFPPLIQQLCGFESVEHSPVPSEGIDFASLCNF